MRRELYTEEHDLFRQSVRTFYEREVVPHHARWDEAGIVDRSLFTAAGAQGLLAFQAPERFGGAGVDDFRFNAIMVEEAQYAAVSSAGLSLSLHTDIVLPYFTKQADEAQQERWLPGIVSGELITAVAMTEPGAGSDLAGIRTTAERRGDVYVLNGSKTFITNGINADLVVVAVKTDPSQRHRGMSLIVVEADTPGFERGRNLHKVGLHAQDTAELHFTDAEVPVSNLLGTEGEGFGYLTANLAQERLSIAIAGVAAARSAVDLTLAYVKERDAFGQPIARFQNTQFVLAECETEVEVTQHYIDRCILALNAGELTATDAAKAKWWATELQKRVTDRCLQLFGGYGYVTEYPIARLYADARITTIYGGTTEIMKTIIAKDLGLR
ncbi:MAG: acyl-CoA dehydrogenase family protein [Nitriliruptor sp.]|uniref:acyl-CoA dehydrogenase family protein n=1 Tax=Nitriliruptor sp. TaxID=2448056 RepID=UPI00349FEF29